MSNTNQNKETKKKSYSMTPTLLDELDAIGQKM